MIDEIKIIENIQKLNINEIMIIISKPFNTFGFVLLLLFFYIYNILNSKDIEIIFIGTILNILLKLFFKRTRPYQKYSNIRNFSNKVHHNIFDKYSFPSGHTFSSTLLSLILVTKYKENTVINLIPIFVGLSRVFLGVHYPSDIIFGLIIALLYFKIAY
jgi:undecaprenyl-diphosphatase